MEGVKNRDWEDLAYFNLAGRHYLLIADIGDNLADDRWARLHIVEEPLPAEKRISPAWSIRFTFPDGPRNCESVAVDADQGLIYLISKETKPPVLYSLPLQSRPSRATLRATRRGEIRAIPPPRPEELRLRPRFGKYNAQPTAMDLSTQSNRAVILTYKQAYLFHRAPGDTWTETLTGNQAQIIRLPPVAQAEAIAFGRDGKTLYLTSEKLPTPLYRLQEN